MDINGLLNNRIMEILELARFAPSVHNTQPWIVAVRDDNILIQIDQKYRLEDGDPVGRQTMISLGIFSEAVVIAARKYNLLLKQVTLSDAGVALRFGFFESKTDNTYADLIRKRVSDRSVYKRIAISPEMVTALENSDQQKGIGISVRTDPEFIARVSDLTARGIAIALSNPGFRKELSKFILPARSIKKRGISVKNLYIPKIRSMFEPLLLRFGWKLDKEAIIEKERWNSASGIICITSQSDMPRAWFDAGRTYLQVALLVEKLGLSQATSAAAVEASTYHHDLEQMLGTTRRLQCVIRIGEGRKKRQPSPRVDAVDLLAT